MLNEVEIDEYLVNFRSIAPTRSDNGSGEGQGAPRGQNLGSEPQRQAFGRYNKHPQYQQRQNIKSNYQQRQSRQDTPRIYSEHAPPPVSPTAIVANGKRQANPDIQDIITGIVKLLNGNVNVVGNTARPLRPIQPTRWTIFYKKLVFLKDFHAVNIIRQRF